MQTTFVSAKELSALTGRHRNYFHRATRLGELKQGIHFFKCIGGKGVMYNRELITDWIVNGNSPAHQRACEKFLQSLPSYQEPA